MLKHTKGNLIDLAEKGKFDIIVHGCNCFNTMGSGIAKEIRARYPDAYEADTNYSAQVGKNWNYMKLGNYSATDVFGNAGKFKIINAYTQYNFNGSAINGEVFNDVFEYDSFKLILQKLHHFYGNYDFGFPRIGQGLAGGNPERINQMLSDFAVAVSEKGGTVTIVDFDGN